MQFQEQLDAVNDDTDSVVKYHLGCMPMAYRLLPSRLQNESDFSPAPSKMSLKPRWRRTPRGLPTPATCGPDKHNGPNDQELRISTFILQSEDNWSYG